MQPVQNIPAYLASRRPVPHFSHELPLYITLADEIRREVSNHLVAFDLVQLFLKAGLSVEKACLKTMASIRVIGGSCKTFRAKFDAWNKTSDWLVLVNKAKAGPAWQDGPDLGLPDDFIDKACAVYCARFGRRDAKAEVVRVIKRWWKTGKDVDDVSRPIPGYEMVGTRSTGSPIPWSQRNRNLLPPGWHYTNILRQVRERRAFTNVDRALCHEGIAAAKELLPQVEGTASDLLFMEEVTFDDVRTDIIVIDPETGNPCELWLLVARCKGTRLALGFVEHLSMSRLDGSDSHLGQKEMKQLAAWLLERYHLPPYPVIWRVERGTATLSESSALALQELLPGRIKVCWTSMIGGQSPVGYKEKGKGNSRGKGSHEAHNRMFHIQGSFLPGQTGAHYGIRPADLNARIKESVETWELRNRLPAHQRGQEKYSLLTPREARKHLTRFCLEQNFRTDHTLEGFEEIMEWYDPQTGDWRPQNTFSASRSKPLDSEKPGSGPGGATGSMASPTPSNTAPARAVPSPGGEGQGEGELKIKFRPRKESPVERAIRLIAPYRDKWESISPDVIIAFLAHTQRTVPIKETGVIQMQINNRVLKFYPPLAEGERAKFPGKGLAYYSEDDPGLLHVTDGRGSILGTWFRRDRVSGKDQAALQAAIRYTANALKTAQTHAAALKAPEREQLEAMRAHNLALVERGNEFVEIASAPTCNLQPATCNSPVASFLTTTVQKTRASIKAQQKQKAADVEDTRSLLMKSLL